MRRSIWIAGLVLASVLGGAACSSSNSEVPEGSQSSDGEGHEGNGEQAPAKEPAEEPAESPVAVAGDRLTLEDYLATLAEMYGLEDPPKVDVIREVDPRERGAILAECLQEHGFAGQVDSNGGWGAEYPTAQQEAFDLASYVCEAQYPLMPVFYRPFDTEILNRIYDHYEETVMPCVHDAGWEVDLVSREQFITRYEATRELGTDFFDLPDAIILKCYDNIPEEVILGE